MRTIRNLVVREISLLKRGTRPAVPAAKVALAKRADDAMPTPEPMMVHKVWPSLGAAASVQPAATAQPPHQEVTSMSEVQKAEATLDTLVRKRRERHEDETEAVAMTKVLGTSEGKRAYAQMTVAKDFAVAKGSTLLTYEKRNVLKGNVPPDYAGAADAWAKLDELAKDEAAKTGSAFYVAYQRVIGTPHGKELYRLGNAAPSLAGAVT